MSKCGRVEKAGSRGTLREKEDLDFGLFLLKSAKTVLRKDVRKLHLINSYELCRHINAPDLKTLLFVPEVMDFSTNPCICIGLKTSHNKALFERKVVIVHFYLKEPTSTPASPSVLPNEIKSERANCMCEGS